MSPRKKILRELRRGLDHDGGTPLFTRPAEIAGFASRPQQYQKAVNELLKARLVEGRQDEAGRMTIALNAHRLRDVERELRPVWAHPAVWAALAIVLAVGAGLAI